MPTILALDTISNMCTVALLHNGQQYIHSAATPSKHAEVILGFIDIVLDKAKLNKKSIEIIAPSIGPGSFIGVRTCISVAQTIAFALGCKVAPLPSLQIMAQDGYNTTQKNKVLALLDARMSGLYWGEYSLTENQIMRRVAPNTLHNIDVLPEIDLTEYCVATNALDNYPELHAALEQRGAVNIYETFPKAEEMLQLALDSYENNKLIDATELKPLYVRNDVARKPKATKE